MHTNWIGMVVLAGFSLLAGIVFTQIWGPVQGQLVQAPASAVRPGGFSVEPPQVVVQQPAVLPKWCVDFVPLPAPPGQPQEYRLITVVDTELKKIAVYRLNITTGQVWWLSTRNIQPDLAIDQYNATSPLPSEITKEIQRMQDEK